MFPRSLLVRAAAALLVLALVAGCTTDPEREAATLAAAGQGDLREFHIYVHEGVDMEPLPGKRIGFFAFSFSPEGGASVPGPEIRVKEGDRVRVVLHQPGGTPHTIHFHGISLPWAMDGVPFMTQDVAFEASTYTYEFDAKETGTYWYHCHVDAPTHIDFGLLGALIVEPRDPAADPPFDREATLILHEAAATDPFNSAFFNDRETGDERLPGPDDALEWAQRQPRGYMQVAGLIAAGMTGVETPLYVGPRDYHPDISLRYHPYYDTFMINGKSFPETEPVHVESGETVRIRLINGGQLLHTMHLHGHHFLVTHKDGYKLPFAYYADSIVIGPGERYDVYVKADNPGIWDFHDHGGAWELGAYAANDHAFPGGMNTMLVYDDFEFPGLPEPDAATRSGDYMVFAKRHSVPPPTYSPRVDGAQVPVGAGHAHGGAPTGLSVS